MAAGPNIIELLLGGSLVVQGVLLILIALSVWSWAIVIAKTFQFRKARQESDEFRNLFWESRNLARLDDTARRLSGSPLAQLFSNGYREFVRVLTENSTSRSLSDLESVQTALRRAEVDESHRLEKGIVFLATVSSGAPFIGLFGTVWGIMNAFMGLSAAKSSSIQAVAPGISEALIATAVGLAAAIPAAVAYNYFSSIVRQFRQSMGNFTDEFLSIAKRNYVTPNVTASRGGNDRISIGEI
jgi:biopolymer transport protein TolQ